MVSLEIIEREINELLTHETTYAVCERLCWLYTVRNNLRAPSTRSDMEQGLTEALSGSEFLESASDVPYPPLMKILDEHMTALRVVQPKEYNAVMDRIRAL